MEMEELWERMIEIEGPRHPSYAKYSLADILTIVMCGILRELDTLDNLVYICIRGARGHYSAGFTLDTYTHITTSMKK